MKCQLKMVLNTVFTVIGCNPTFCIVKFKLRYYATSPFLISILFYQDFTYFFLQSFLSHLLCTNHIFAHLTQRAPVTSTAYRIVYIPAQPAVACLSYFTLCIRCYVAYLPHRTLRLKCGRFQRIAQENNKIKGKLKLVTKQDLMFFQGILNFSCGFFIYGC